MKTTPAPSGIEAEVCADITRRQVHGLVKYGQTVADNPLPLRAWLQHAYAETLDKAIYLRRAIAEIDAAQGDAASAARIAHLQKQVADAEYIAWQLTHDPAE